MQILTTKKGWHDISPSHQWQMPYRIPSHYCTWDIPNPSEIVEHLGFFSPPKLEFLGHEWNFPSFVSVKKTSWKKNRGFLQQRGSDLHLEFSSYFLSWLDGGFAFFCTKNISSRNLVFRSYLSSGWGFKPPPFQRGPRYEPSRSLDILGSEMEGILKVGNCGWFPPEMEL